MYKITFHRQGSAEDPVTLTKIAPGQSLLEVAIDHSLGLNHDCGGMSSCGTCHIYLREGNSFVEFKSKRETHQLAKRTDLKSDSRLACQCVLLPGEGHLHVDLPATYSMFST